MAFAALALSVFSAIECPPKQACFISHMREM